MGAVLGVSERRACRVIGQHRSTQRKRPRRPADEQHLTEDIMRLASVFRMLTVIDEHSRECLAIHVQRKLKSNDVLDLIAIHDSFCV